MAIDAQKIIARHNRLQNLLEANDTLLFEYFLNKHGKQIDQVTDLAGIEEIKNQLRVMPHSAAKVLIFKRILGKIKEIVEGQRI